MLTIDFIRAFTDTKIFSPLFGSDKKDKPCKVCGDLSYSGFCSRECVKAYHGTKAQREAIRKMKAAQRTG